MNIIPEKENTVNRKNKTNKKELVGENMITRWLSNAIFKKIFRAVYIIGWQNGVYSWERTPHGKENDQIAFNALKELVQYYEFIGQMDVKTIKKAQSNQGIGAWFKGWWAQLKNRIMGNPGKLEALVKFNNGASSQIKELFNALDGWAKQSEREKAKKKPVSEAESGTDDEKKKEELRTKAANAIDGIIDIKHDMEDGDLKKSPILNQFKSIFTGIFGSPDDPSVNSTLQQIIDKLAEKGEDTITKVANAANKFNDISKTNGVKFAEKIVNDGVSSFSELIEAIENFDPSETGGEGGEGGMQLYNKYLASFRKLANGVQDEEAKRTLPRLLNSIFSTSERDTHWKNPGKEHLNVLTTGYDEFKRMSEDETERENLGNILVQRLPETMTAFAEFIMDICYGKISSDDDKKGKETDVGSIEDYVSQFDDVESKQIQWDGGKGMTASIQNIYVAENSLYKLLVYYDSTLSYLYNGEWITEDGYIDVNLTELLSSPSGQYIKRLRKVVDSLSKLLQTSSAFGSLQESTVKQFGKGFILLAESQEKREKIMKEQEEVKNALNVLKEASIGWSGYPKEEKIETPKPKMTILDKDDVDSFVDPLAALKKLKSAVFDEEMIVNEAPGDDAPAADDQPPQPDAPMSIGDLGDPPGTDAPPPDAGGGAVAPAPDMGGGAGGPAPDMGGGDPMGGPAPAPDMGGGDMGGGDAGDGQQAPADQSAQQGQDGQQQGQQEQPQGQDKFDIGAVNPVNGQEDLHLTDEEQEQLFTKINLLAKVPDLVNYGKYLYNITPENVDLNDIHYINTLYDLSVKLGLIVDEFENNNLLSKFDTYAYSVLTKSPEKDLQNATNDNANLEIGNISESKIKTKDGFEVEFDNAPGLITAKDVDEYMRLKKKLTEDEVISDKEEGEDIEGPVGLGWVVTFSAVLFGSPLIKSVYVKRQGNKSAEKQAIEYISKLGYKKISILTIENVDPADVLAREYTGMRNINDICTQAYLDGQYIDGVVNESVEFALTPEAEHDIDKCIDMLNDEIMANQEFNFRGDCGIPKMQIDHKEFKQALIPTVNEADKPTSYKFKLVRNANNVSRMFFGSNCRKLCKCLEGFASTVDFDLKAEAKGDNIELTFTRFD